MSASTSVATRDGGNAPLLSAGERDVRSEDRWDSTTTLMRVHAVEPARTLHILVCGARSSGKSTLIERYARRSASSAKNDGVVTRDIQLDGVLVRMRLIEIPETLFAGQGQLREDLSRSADGALFVYSPVALLAPSRGPALERTLAWAENLRSESGEPPIALCLTSLRWADEASAIAGASNRSNDDDNDALRAASALGLAAAKRLGAAFREVDMRASAIDVQRAIDAAIETTARRALARQPRHKRSARALSALPVTTVTPSQPLMTPLSTYCVPTPRSSGKTALSERNAAMLEDAAGDADADALELGLDDDGDSGARMPRRQRRRGWRLCCCASLEKIE